MMLEVLLAALQINSLDSRWANAHGRRVATSGDMSVQRSDDRPVAILADRTGDEDAYRGKKPHSAPNDRGW